MLCKYGDGDEQVVHTSAVTKMKEMELRISDLNAQLNKLKDETSVKIASMTHEIDGNVHGGDGDDIQMRRQNKHG